MDEEIFKKKSLGCKEKPKLINLFRSHDYSKPFTECSDSQAGPAGLLGSMCEDMIWSNPHMLWPALGIW